MSNDSYLNSRQIEQKMCFSVGNSQMDGWKDTVNVPVFLGKFYGLTNLTKLLVSTYYVSDLL